MSQANEAATSASDTLQDFLAPNLAIVSVGINPSPISVTEGYPFASRRNRFWAALNQSKLITSPVEPSIGSMLKLLEIERIGFTDIVKRPTKQANELRAGDYKMGTSALAEKLAFYCPAIVWFQGMLAARAFFKHTELPSKHLPEWGAQQVNGCGFGVYISPNPSPANASFSLEDLVGYYNDLAHYRTTLSRGYAAAEPNA